MKGTIEKMRPHVICEILPRTGDIVNMYEIIKPFGYFIYEILENRINPIEKISEYKRNSCIDFLFSPYLQTNLQTGN